MYSKLSIVKGGVATKDLTPILSHLKIENGWVTSTNGRLTISTPLPEMGDLNIIVPASKFITAVKTCGEPKFKITPTGKLSITGKKFRAILTLLEDQPFPSPESVGEEVQCTNLLEVLNKLSPFIGNDASRPWACGVLLHDNTAYATNNAIIAKHAIEWDGPSVNLPDFLVSELLRLNLNIKKIKVTDTTITFLLDESVWINSVLLAAEWPNAKELFSKVDFNNLVEVDPELLPAVEAVIPFCPDKKFPRIKFSDKGISTDEGNQEAKFLFVGLPESIWRAEHLLNILSNIHPGSLFWDFSQWPRPCPWRNKDGLEGLIIGLKQ